MEEHEYLIKLTRDESYKFLSFLKSTRNLFIETEEEFQLVAKSGIDIQFVKETQDIVDEVFEQLEFALNERGPNDHGL